ncbi:glycerate kinase [Companilactobacillus alimentarius]|uniref:Glycerate kinase n=1 Tax=Companilactobacillus alimentarius DSM 20249 TaxID=1423720 RepID=A0A2K9HIS3_9LACO|nr:glycerate kinase [Companilactobacillus alimentarius]AUI72451.1 glycerate kinase [Companilactobacillus alimentarius DSM 20249]KRK77781.1 glycerate kinase [Companilactobacillus alimentarius DSM 20249]MDT6953041.1 glycerate kinase [Companilactobacillus alimentarius]GEO44980.1 glycerate kinase [Companilactobacillus alimentarius]
MKFIIAPGKYSNNISSTKIGQAIYSGISRAMPDAQIITMPVTDSKDGMPALVEHTIGGRWKKVSYFDAFWSNRIGHYLITKVGSQDTAIMDSEQVVGIDLAKEKTRNDLFHATSYGLGEFIIDAVTDGIKNIVLCLGKTAVADGGLGALQALGAKIYDENGVLVPEGENPLINAFRVDLDDVYQLLGSRTKITVLLNYTTSNRLSQTLDYLNEAQESFLEDNLVFVTEKLNQKYNLDIHPMPHSGSIKTLAGAFAMINASISRSSFEWVAKVTGMDETIKSCNILVTATDRISREAMQDDMLNHLSRIAGSQRIPTFALCNNFVDDFQSYEQLFTGIFSTQMTEYDDEMTMFENYESVANQLVRTLLTFK